MILAVVAAGVIVGGTAVRYSLYLVNSVPVPEHKVQSGVRHMSSSSMMIGGAVLGGVTGWLLYREEPGSSVALVAVVTLLLLVQGPFDFVTMRLSRPVTASAFVATAAIATIDAFVTDSWSKAATALLAAAVVVAIFGILHRSVPKSLGFGDVLLVAPIAHAVAYVFPQDIPVWLLVASASAAIHGGARRLRRSAPMVPFGPHLLGAGWLTLVMNV